LLESWSRERLGKAHVERFASGILELFTKHYGKRLKFSGDIFIFSRVKFVKNGRDAVHATIVTGDRRERSNE
jgi:hypothetical protein